ncbi:hypothetical protein ACFQDE_13995 [Deinococcus caeni]
MRASPALAALTGLTLLCAPAGATHASGVFVSYPRKATGSRTPT